TKSINNFTLPGKWLRSPKPRHPSADHSQDRHPPVESALLRAKTDCVEGDFVLPIEICRDPSVPAPLVKLVQIGDAEFEHAAFLRMRELNAIRVRWQCRKRS